MPAMKILKKRTLGFWERFFYSLVMWGGTVFLTLFFSLLDLFVALPLSLLFDCGTQRMIHQNSIRWARSIIGFSPIWRIVVIGREHLQKGKHYIIVANHQSLLDILAVCAALPINFKFLAKRELFQIPFMGWSMAAAGYVPVDRGSHKSGREAIHRITRVLKKSVSVLLFPEGTRSPDGKIHAFKMGAFKLARDNNVEILPVVIDGTGQALPKRSWFIKKKSTFIVLVGKPVSLEDFADGSVEEAKEKIRHEMIAQLARIRHGKDV
ncbi:MAG: lysophospholipid acyltransferase family protein [Candidatus Omnitrophota bacterium]